MNIVFIAPPAAGKGTLGLRISQKWGIPHISTGDLLRNIEDKKLKQKLSQGKFIDDDTVCLLLEKRLLQKDCNKGYVLDGFPRNLNQAKMYDLLLKKVGNNRCIVIILDLEKEIAAKRIIGRKVCPNCKAVYNDLFTNTKPIEENVCDICGFPKTTCGRPYFWSSKRITNSLQFIS